MNGWSTPEDIRGRVQREWDRGHILAAMLGGEAVFPLRIPLKRPGTQALAEHFEEARLWIAELSASDKKQTGIGYRLEWIEFSHRQLGRNRIPKVAVIEDEQDGVALISRQHEASIFRELAATTEDTFPALVLWMQQYPLRVLEQAENWPSLLAVLEWVACHPGANIYLRQIDVPGMDTKFIERHRGLLSELLDRVLLPEVINTRYSGASNFEQRYGFRSKPMQVRFRLLDQKLFIQGLSDIVATSDEFAQLSLPVRRVFITENEINFLAFPDVADSIVLFGAGYGFDHLAQAGWLHQKEIYYWGDIDTHGFAILDQLRSKFPSAHSFLMDRATLLEHRKFCVNEVSPISRQLERLRLEESALYDDLRFDRIARSLRLEQERIGFACVITELEKIGLK